MAGVPWASLDSGFTYALDWQIAWMFLHMNKEAIANFFGIDWNSVQAAIDRVIKRLEKDLLDLVRNFGTKNLGYMPKNMARSSL